MRWARYGHPVIYINGASDLESRVLVVLVRARCRFPSSADMLIAAPSDRTVPATRTPAWNNSAIKQRSCANGRDPGMLSGEVGEASAYPTAKPQRLGKRYYRVAQKMLTQRQRVKQQEGRLMWWARYGHPRTHINVSSRLDRLEFWY